MLSGILRDEMPYRDPHTAAPAMWAQKQISGEGYEASTCPIEGDARSRKAMEAIAISLYRQERHRSPDFNFGRMPSGFLMSSGNMARLAKAGKRFRGGPCEGELECHLPSIPPVGPLSPDLDAADWCGHGWSEWRPIEEVIGSAIGFGLYRVRSAGGELLYIGQGAIQERLWQHHRKAGSTPQGRIFSEARPLSCSWVSDHRWYTHQRLELENDLIAAFVLATGRAPAAQFAPA
jgi:hypothetical protein